MSLTGGAIFALTFGRTSLKELELKRLKELRQTRPNIAFAKFPQLIRMDTPMYTESRMRLTLEFKI